MPNSSDYFMRELSIKGRKNHIKFARTERIYYNLAVKYGDHQANRIDLLTFGEIVIKLSYISVD